MRHVFSVECVPPKCTSQGKRAVRIGNGIRFFKQKNYEIAEESLTALFSRHKPKRTFTGCLRVEVIVEYPYRKSEPKKRVSAGKCLPMTSKPDCDNLSKMLLDVMTHLCFWTDDSLIYDLRVQKYWGPNPNIYVSINDDEEKWELEL